MQFIVGLIAFLALTIGAIKSPKKFIRETKEDSGEPGKWFAIFWIVIAWGLIGLLGYGVAILIDPCVSEVYMWILIAICVIGLIGVIVANAICEYKDINNDIKY